MCNPPPPQKKKWVSLLIYQVILIIMYKVYIHQKKIIRPYFRPHPSPLTAIYMTVGHNYCLCDI